MQGDGNLVLYRGGSALWSTATKTAGSRAVMQGDGNLVVYNGSTAKWSSSTARYANARLHLQDDGNLVIYQGGRAVWTRGSGHIGEIVLSGQTLTPGAVARSENGAYRLIMQGDGNLVLYEGSTALWNKGGGAGARAVMQSDGNLVIYNGSIAKWNSGTAGNPGAYLAVQTDGNLVIYRGSTAIWTRNSGGSGQYSPPDWWPLRGSNLVGCTRNSTGPICGGNYHSWWAIDVSAPEGSPIYAAGAGRASMYSNSTGCSGYGRAVAIDHGGGVRSLYAHMSNFATGIDGAMVGPGTVIGYVGGTGYSEPCGYVHLHYEETNGGFGAGARDPGELQACIGSQRVSYPSYWGQSSWNGLPGQSYTARSDSTAC
jgi:hypothetical protein